MRYVQLTYEERVMLSTLRQQGLPVREIAKQLGRHFSTIYRELKRNSCSHIDGSYRPSKAERRTRARRSRSRRNRHYTDVDFKIIRKLLRQKWSPEQISGHIRRHSLMPRHISHETIYQYLWRDKADGGNLLKLRDTHKFSKNNTSLSPQMQRQPSGLPPSADRLLLHSPSI